MSIIHTTLLNCFTNIKNKEKIVYYPDVIPFMHTEDEYNRHWQMLSQSPYLYTNGYELEPVGWFYYAFQSVKGFFGLNNYCQVERVQYTLKKLAFYGYLKGYSQEVLGRFSHSDYALAPEYLKQVSVGRNNETTQFIQQDLINFYDHHSLFLETDKVQADWNTNSIYGKTWEQLKKWEYIPFLDPQDEELIQKTIVGLSATTNYDHLHSSKYTNAAAIYFLGKAKDAKKSPLSGNQELSCYLTQVCTLNPQIPLHEPLLFIGYYLEKKDFQTAVNLLEWLDEHEVIVDYLSQYLTEEQLKNYIRPDSFLGLHLALYYVNALPSPKARGVVSKLVGRLNNTISIENIRLAAHFNTNLAAQFPVEAIYLLLDTNRFEEAYNLYVANCEQHSFTAQQCTALATHFFTQGKLNFEKANKVLKNADMGDTKELYFLSMEYLQRACQLKPKKIEYSNALHVTKRSYVELLIDIEKIKHKSPEHYDLSIINSALKILAECESTDEYEQERNQLVRAKVLMCKASYFFHQLILPTECYSSPQVRKKYILDNKDRFDLIYKEISKALTIMLIPMLQGTNKDELKLILVKAHFMLGDLCNFLGIEQHEQHYENAKAVAPKNTKHLLVYLNDLLLEADNIRKKLTIPEINNYNLDVRNQYIRVNNAVFNQFLRQVRGVLEKVILLGAGTLEKSSTLINLFKSEDEVAKDNKLKIELKIMLGKAHFMLADIIKEFKLPGEYKRHYKLASEANPNNPIYLKMAAQYFPEEYKNVQARANFLMKQLKLEEEDYNLWVKYRWQREKPDCVVIHDVHNLSSATQEQQSSSKLFST